MSGNNNRLKILLILILIVVIGAILAIFIGYRFLSGTPARLLTTIGEKTDMRIDHLHQTATRDGKKEWTLNAASARLTEGGKKAHLADLSVTFFMKDGAEALLSAKHGILDTQTNDFQVSGDIVLKNKTYQLHTQTLQYHHKGRIISIDAPVEIISARMRFNAERMTYDVIKGKAILENNVRGELKFNAFH